MANVRTLQRSFGGGEVTPEFYGRIDDAKYQSGMAMCKNFIVLPHGPAQNRPGFEFVRAVKYNQYPTRLIPFSYSDVQTMVLEVGHKYIRFHTNGATLIGTNGAPYEVATPYSYSDVFDLHFVQSSDVLTLVHPGYPPAELRRYGSLDWRYAVIQFASQLNPPSSVSATAKTADTPNNQTTYRYKVTTIGADGIEESLPSGAASCVNNLLQDGAYNDISWPAAAGARRYNVYKQVYTSIYAYVGQSDTLTFRDDNITADISITPPEANNPFNGPGDYPAAVSYFEQRRVFAGTTNQPSNIWMTRSGTESNMSMSLPVRDDDSIQFKVAARESNSIRHIVPLSTMVLLTGSAEWRITSVNSDAITPSTISVRPQSYIGSSNVQPMIINNNMVYAASRGGHLRELSYSWQANGFVTGDLSLRAPHLFDYSTIVDLDYSKAPQPIVWAVSSNGKLIGLTYVPEQQVGAWHQHETDGSFEAVTSVNEGEEDVVYVIVKRTINGSQVRYIERLHTRKFTDTEDAFFVDCGGTYDGTIPDAKGVVGGAISTVSGLNWLEGKTVSILADGAVCPQQVVTGGKVSLPAPATKIHIGLPYESDIQTLPWAAQLDAAYGQGRQKNVNKVWLRVNRSSGIFVGPDADHLTEAKQRTTEAYGTPPNLVTDEVQVNITPSWNNSGQVYIRQSEPLPLTLVSMSMEVAMGA